MNLFNKYLADLSAGTYLESNGQTKKELILFLKNLDLTFSEPIGDDYFAFYKGAESMYRYVLNNSDELLTKVKERFFTSLEDKALEQNLNLYFDFILEYWDLLKNYTYTYRSLSACIRLVDESKLKKHQEEILTLITS